MFIPERRSPGWALVAFGLFVGLLSLVGLSGILGFVPEGGRAGTITWFGLPVALVFVIVGVVKIARHTPAPPVEEQEDDENR